MERGLRKSASINSTLFPAWAMATARLAAVADLPSLGKGLETTKILLPGMVDDNRTAVRIDR